MKNMTEKRGIGGEDDDVLNSFDLDLEEVDDRLEEL